MTPSIVLISGKQGSGKTTLSNKLIETIDRRSNMQGIGIIFAGPIYEMHHAVRGILKKYQIKFDETKKDGNLLQLLGTEWGRRTIADNIWVDAVKGSIKHNIENAFDPSRKFVFVISDCRFENEFNGLPDALRVRLECREEVRKQRVEMWRENSTHQSEIDLDIYSDAGMFDMYFNTEVDTPEHITELIIAQLLKNVWKEKRR